MQIQNMNWMQVEEYLKHDNRCVLPIGSTEQHAYLSLSVDSILSEKVSVDAAEAIGVPVFPRLNYGITPYFTGFPGTISLRLETALAVARDVLDNMHRAGFRRIVVVNGHGGNNPVQTMIQEWMATNTETRVKFHNWWMAPKTWAKVKEIDPVASHASWMENFPWTRLKDVELPQQQKTMINFDRMRMFNPQQVRELIGDGNYGGDYQKADALTDALWEVAVAETRDLINGPWE